MDDLKTFLQQQNTLIELLVKNMSISSRTDVSNSTMTPDSIANSIAEFRFDPESGVTFEAWFKRHEDLFINECKEWDESSKLRLLLRKLGVSEHEKFCNFILPKKPSDITFKETVECLTRIFGERSSIFHTRYQCLQLVKKVQDDYVTYASIVNRECERFRLQEMSSDQFKCLIFVCGLQSPVDADIRTRTLTRIEQDPNISLQSVSEDCQRMVNLKHDTNLVERNSEHVGVNALRKSLNGDKDSNSQKIPNQVKHKTSCWRCGKSHSAKVCYFKKRVCFQCGKYGHAQVCCKSKPKVSDRQHKFRKGNKIQTSKVIAHNRKLEEDIVVASISIEPEIKKVFCDAIRILPVTAEAVQEATGSDPLLKRIKEAVLKGWKQDKADREFHQFFLRRESISIYDNCLMYGERVVIPRSLQLFVLKQFHIGHPGMNRMKAVMRSYVYWPFMDKAVEEYVVRCRRCAEVAKDPPKVESQPWPETTKPWVRLHVDYAGPISGQYFLVVVDSYSKWSEIYVVRRPSTSETLLHLRQLFGRFGTPNVLVSDNGTQFTSLEFAEFCKQNGIEHVRTPPYHPKSNGQAEKFVDILKRALLRWGGEGNVEEALQQFLISYRITPSPNCQDGKSPAEIMFGRPIRTFFDVLNPKDRISGLQKNNKGNCLKIREFKVGDSVYARDFRPGKPKWIFGFIKKRRGTVLYEVMVENTLIIRHVNQLRDRKCVYESSKLKPLPMEVLCDTFDIPPPPPQVEMRKNDLESEVRRRSFRKRKQTKFFQIDPKVKSYDRTSRGR
uniref:Gag-pol polyprotein n=1 Tax=Schistosoma mansoni TaxID=6183 RepID=Q4QQF1_SCHMA|nr:TPA: gag-pol polyprotein [Schistosoma mansoni]